MNVLEQRYRRVLRLLPPSYRAVWEDEMAATFLDRVSNEDGRDPEDARYLTDYGRPGWPEIASVALLSLRLRLGTAGAPPRYRAWGAAIPLALPFLLLAESVAAVFFVAVRLWVTGRLPLLPPPDLPMVTTHVPEPLYYLPLLWVAAFAAILLTRRRAAVGFVAAVIVTNATLMVLRDAVDGIGVGGLGVLLLLQDALLLVGLAAFHPDATLPRPRPWLTAGAVGVVLGTGAMFALVVVEPTSVLLDWHELCCLAVALAALVNLSDRGLRGPAWTHALALLSFIAVAERLASGVEYLRSGLFGPPAAVTVILAAQVLLVSVPAAFLVRRTIRDLRQLPPLTPGESSWSVR